MIAPLNSAGHVLLLKRQKDQHCGDLWSFAGGKVEAGESTQEAAVRELEEETNLIGTDWKLLGHHSFEYPSLLLHFVFYRCVCESVTTLRAESEYAWVAFNQLSDYPMPAANNVLIEMLVRG